MNIITTLAQCKSFDDVIVLVMNANNEPFASETVSAEHIAAYYALDSALDNVSLDDERFNDELTAQLSILHDAANFDYQTAITIALQLAEQSNQ